ncbi:MAG TPA: alkaline phosphatase family protein, partial [Candidatus Dormibacteraeota bacterium]|nr:alkaline phosphatase family protein [Candidatus Dormibacteraeota bacterium]
MKAPRRELALIMLTALTAACVRPSAALPSPSPPQPTGTLTGIHKIQHVVVIMQENRSFDQYFGTYP